MAAKKIGRRAKRRKNVELNADNDPFLAAIHADIEWFEKHPQDDVRYRLPYPGELEAIGFEPTMLANDSHRTVIEVARGQSEFSLEHRAFKVPRSDRGVPTSIDTAKEWIN